jgi:hypothetical protein
MRKYLILTTAAVAVIALTAVGIATAANNKPVTVRSGNLELTVNGGFTPTTLPKSKLAPISFFASGKIATVDGSHPPALKEFLVEADKNSGVQTKGFPTCTSGKLQSQDTSHAEAICKDAIIGTGATDIEVAFPESKVVPAHSKLLVFNGGTSGGTTTFYIHAYITVPVPSAVVTTVKIKKIHKGRYGYLAIGSIPKIAGGSGSVTSFSLTINKKYTYKGKKMSILSAKCPDGKLQANGTAVFADGTRASAGVVRTCTGKG